MNLVTPRGFRDRLPAEAAERRSLIDAIDSTFESWGYGRIETPAVEMLDVLETAAGNLEGTAFRLFDADGRLLALRPEMTIPIARVVASRLRDEPGPHRLRYVADVFREHESLRGQPRQFTQLGVELIGSNGPASDAEIVAVLVDALRAAGLPEFTVAIGTVGLLQALLDASGMDWAWRADVLVAAHERNLVALDRLVTAPGVDTAAGAAISAVLRIRGGRHAIEECRAAAGSCDCDEVLDALEETWDLLEAAELAGHVVVDFGVLRSFDYYTGIVLEAYAPGLGVPLGGGGRYDRVLASFGAPAPAAGFALGLDRLQVALLEQSAPAAVRGLDAVLGGNPSERFSAAVRLRQAGWTVMLSAREGLDLLREAERHDAAEALVARGGAIVRLDREGQPSIVVENPIPPAPHASWSKGGRS